MINLNVKAAKPGMSNATVINTIARNVKSLRNMRPVGGSLGLMSLPWGQAIVPGRDGIRIAFSGDGGIPAATIDANNRLTLGMGSAYLAYPVFGDDGVTVTLDYKINRGTDAEDYNTSILAYNLAHNSDGAVGANHWIILERIYGLWVVTWEECPS